MVGVTKVLGALVIMSSFSVLFLMVRQEEVEADHRETGLDCSWLPSVDPLETWFLDQSSEELCGGCVLGEVSKTDNILTIFCAPNTNPRFRLDDEIGIRAYTGPVDIGESEFVVIHCDTSTDPRNPAKTCAINRELIVHNAYKPEVHQEAKDRAEEAKAHLKSNEKNQKLDFQPNIMLLMFDSAARKHAHRRIPNTLEYLRQLNESADSGVKIFEMQKYNVVGLNSPANFLGFLTGHPHADDLHTESLGWAILRYIMNDRQIMSPYKTAVTSYDKWIWALLHKYGYVSMFSEGICFDKTLRVMGFSDNIKETYDTNIFGWKPFNYPINRLPHLDYFFYNTWCQEENKLMNIYEKTHSHDAKPKCICFGRKFAHEQTFDYLDEFYRNYHDVPKFSFTAFQEPHDRTMQIFGTVDLGLKDFIERLNSGWNVTTPHHGTADEARAKSILQESIVFIYADHGMNFGDYALNHAEGWWEHKLPEMLVSVPSSILEKFPEIGEALAHNSHSLVTAYDLFATLMHIPIYPEYPDLPNPKISKSLFTKIDPSRNCDDAYIPPEYCAEKVEKHEVCWQSGHACEVAAENGRQQFVWDLMQKELHPSENEEPVHVLPEVQVVMHIRHVQMLFDTVGAILAILILWGLYRGAKFLYTNFKSFYRTRRTRFWQH